MSGDLHSLTPTLRRFSGFAGDYDRYRPPPPAALAGVLRQFLGGSSPKLVVDLGSGTGLSSRYWIDAAREIVGIEPTADMRAQAEAHAGAGNLRYQAGFGHRTGLPTACADIVVCMQALHWMEPRSTFEEVRRILRPGGVFAAVDYDWPPVTGDWRAEQAWIECSERAERMEQSLPRDARPQRWDKAEHLARMRASGCFHYSRELLLHHCDTGDAERLIGLLYSQGGIQDLLKAARTHAELGLDSFEEIARRQLGTGSAPWYWSARVRVGLV
jgi:SAM-dependent methyltransferase